jgi:hypothetical protein
MPIRVAAILRMSVRNQTTATTMFSVTAAIVFLAILGPTVGAPLLQVSEPAWLALWGFGLIVFGNGIRRRIGAGHPRLIHAASSPAPVRQPSVSGQRHRLRAFEPLVRLAACGYHGMYSKVAQVIAVLMSASA